MFSHVYASWEAIQKEKFQEIFRRLGTEFLDGRLILDIGAGSGYLEEFLEKKGAARGNIIALEPERAMIKSRENFVLGIADEMPFKKAVFDIAFIFDVIHLVDRIDAGCLKKGCLVICTIFYNDINYREKREGVLKKLGDFEIIDEFSMDTKEKELVIIARKE